MKVKQSSIRVNTDTLNRFRKCKPKGISHNDYINMLLDREV